MSFVAGHFGEWVQGRLGQAGELALVTLACPVAGVRATVEPADELSIREATPLLGEARCRRFLEFLGLSATGRITLDADLPPGGGAGMSTAALVALARAFDASETLLPAACLAVEGATDPVMLDAPDTVLWAPRAAKVLSGLPSPPRAEIVGGFWGAPCVTDPSDHGFPNIEDLVAAWSNGPDLVGAARLASLSAERTTAMRGPIDDPTPAIARRLGALGFARAHTGPARALIFAPGDAPPVAEQTLTEAGFGAAFRFVTGARA